MNTIPRLEIPTTASLPAQLGRTFPLTLSAPYAASIRTLLRWRDNKKDGRKSILFDFIFLLISCSFRRAFRI